MINQEKIKIYHPNHKNMQVQQAYLLQLASSHELANANKNNLHSYSPYTFDYDNSHYVIDSNWYNTLTEQLQQELKQKFKIGQIKEFQYPHQIQKQYQYWEIYTWYNCEVYDYSRYLNQMKEINNQQIYLIKFDGTKQRAQFSQLFFKQQPKINQIQRLNKQIENIVLDQQKNKNGFFVKLTQRSAKNQIKLFPCFSLNDVYKNLICSNDVKKQIYSSSGILLKEWKDFENSKQFRVHVYNKRILGISLQYFRKKVDYKTINFTLLVTLIKDSIKKVNFSKNFVIDLMFINNEKVQFLQFNPYGVYAASRSAIFTQDQLINLERDTQPPIIKMFWQ